MYIKQVKDFDQYSNESDIVVSDGQYDLICYCYPAKMNKSGTKVEQITALFASEIIRVDTQEYTIVKLKDYYSYRLQAKIINKCASIVCVGNLIINLDAPIANDIMEGEYIQFNVARLDCIIG